MSDLDERELDRNLDLDDPAWVHRYLAWRARKGERMRDAIVRLYRLMKKGPDPRPAAGEAFELPSGVEMIYAGFPFTTVQATISVLPADEEGYWVSFEREGDDGVIRLRPRARPAPTRPSSRA